MKMRMDALLVYLEMCYIFADVHSISGEEMKGKIKSLDGLRAIAVFLVIIAHATGIYFHEYEVMLGGSSQFGVWIFFVLSAFLLTSRFISTGFSWRSLLSYFLGRTMRILPVFAIAVLVYSYFGYFDLNTAISIITMKEAVLHFWTIPIEYKFYFILPFFAYAGVAIQKVYNGKAAAFLIFALAVLLQGLYPAMDSAYGGMVMWYFPLFACGMIAAFLYHDNFLKIGQELSDIAFLFFIVSMLIALPKVMWKLTGGFTDGWVLNKFIFYAPIFGLIVLLMSYGEGVFAWALSTPLMSYIGKWSFSIYLWHFLILAMGVWYVGISFYMYIATMVASILVGAVSFYLIENPMEKLRHKIMGMITKMQDSKITESSRA
ncbi:acyltransferase [Escherichia coli]|uniref:acyltransferase family protein n=1 Tax=Escherichia coli TaxID=562 RepID=UPI00165E8FAE|nr:acyltransferase [Escherichia coli]MBS8520736.1 acyltransferase [Escherichia coli]MBS8745702.1 acyltransferase [Escherichia coli]HAM3582554.1 acyltransferase [Escherichia coli]HEI1735616.1 acyltransferase [Escherichia coli]